MGLIDAHNSELHEARAYPGGLHVCVYLTYIWEYPIRLAVGRVGSGYENAFISSCD